MGGQPTVHEQILCGPPEEKKIMNEYKCIPLRELWVLPATKDHNSFLTCSGRKVAHHWFKCLNILCAFCVLGWQNVPEDPQFESHG